jgi:phytoene synthase
MRTAYRHYQGILDEIERAGGDVIRRRAAVPPGRRLALAAACLASRRVPVP